MKILFLCTQNSARSQMAQGLFNHLLPKYKAYSAGTVKTAVNPFAVKVLAEIGIDITHHYSKTLDQYLQDHFDLVVTVCDRVKESCPFFSNAEYTIHKSFLDPSIIDSTDEEALHAFRKIRDKIKIWLLDYFGLNP